jgi:signal transduction histidine kinase
MIAPWLILLLVLLGTFGAVVANRPPAARAAEAAQPRMLWPFAVVGLPLLALAALAAWTLGLDRRSAQDDVRARAGEIAAAVLAQVEDALLAVQPEDGIAPGAFSARPGRVLLVLNERFELKSPSPWVWPPPPAPLTDADFASLSTNKLTQWHAAEAAFARGEWTNAAGLYLAFLEGRRTQGQDPMADFHAGIGNERFRPLALFRRAQALEAAGESAEAILAYDDVLDGFVLGRGGLSESGVPLRVLAAGKVLDLAADQFELLPVSWHRQPASLVGCLVNEPASPLTDDCIQRLLPFGPRLAATWVPGSRPDMIFQAFDRALRGRQLHEQASAQLGAHPWPEVFWVRAKDPWLAVWQASPTRVSTGSPRYEPAREYLVAVLPAARLREELAATVRRLDRPGDFRVIAQAGEMTFALPAEAAASAPALYRQQANLGVPGTATQPLLASVEVGLTNPAAWFRALRRRQALVAAALLGAVGAGLAAAWALRRSLLKQLALNSQKSNFVSSVSHELRAPIASVRLLAESLERGTVQEPAQQREYFRFIGQECRRLSALIENVLDFARIEQGRKQYEFEPTDLRTLVATTVRLMEPMAAEKGVRIEAAGTSQGNGGESQGNLAEEPTRAFSHSPDKHSPDLGAGFEVVVDGRAIQQSLVNLLDNAIKHSPAGAVVGVGLEVRNASPASADHPPSSIHHPRLLLSVSDHGPGIPASEHARIFERFHRLGSELRRETQGVGIGLSIVKHIIEAHGGRVRVESEPGKGSRFTIELPTRSNHE